MKKSNKVISLILSVMLVIGILPMSVFAAETTYLVYVTDSPLDGSGGTVTGEGSYAPGDEVTVSIEPNLENDYCAAQWASADLGMSTIAAFNQKSSHTFTMLEKNVQISITFVQHSYITYTDLEDGTHQNKCFHCQILNGEPEEHIDAHGGGDGTTPPDGYCDMCSADLRETYTITFDYSIPNENEIEIGAGIADKTAEFESGTVVDLSEYWPFELTYKVDETTYYFAGFTKKDEIPIIDSVKVDGNTELEAAWTTEEQITITFETQDGDLFGGTCKSRVNKGYSFNKLNEFYVPALEDHVFKGWCLARVGLPEDEATILNEDTTVYAIWQWNKQPESAWWSTEVKGKAEWKPVDDIDGYIVTLYEAESNGRIDSKIVSNDVTEYIFNSPVIFDENKSFYFTVMACLGNLKSYETQSEPSNPFAATVFDGAIGSAVKVVKADGEISVPVKVIGQGGSRVALTDDVFAFIGKEIDVPVADADKIAISKTTIKWNLGITDEDAEITLEEAKIILADWREFVNTAEGEEQIKSLLPDYSIYELALLIQANNIIGPDDDTEEKLNRLINDERERQKEAAANTQISFGETKVAMDAEALLSIEKALSDGEYVEISAEKIDVTGLADDDVLFDSGVLTGSVIFTEQELLDLKVIEENNDEITWNELKYLYHYMTITELKSLGWFIEDFLYNTDPQVLVWLAEMIERDTIKPLNMQELMDMADLTDEQWELLADADLNDPPIGHLRQAGLTVEQMRKLYDEVRILIGELNDNDKLSNCNELLGWLDDAIAAKEWEADKSQSQPIWAYTARETVIGGVNIDFVAIKAEANSEPYEDNDGITHHSVFTVEEIFTYDELLEFGVFGGDDASISWHDMKLLYHHMTKEDLEKLRNRFSGGSVDLQPFVDWLDEMIERDEQTLDKNAIDLEETNIVENLTNAGYTTGNIKLGLLRRAGLSIEQLQFIKNEIDKTAYPDIWDWVNEAIAIQDWEPKTPIVASGSLAYTIAVDAAYVPVDRATTLRAYKVADDGSLINRTLLAMRNGEDWMLTIESDSNSTYIVTVEDGYEITLNENYSGGATSTLQTDVDGKLTSLPTPTRSGYNFKGWFDAQSGGTEITVDTVFSGATEIYAQWQRRSTGGGSGTTKYTVTFETDGGTEIEAVKVARNGKVEKPDNPTNGNAIFRGWYTDKELTNEYDFDTKVTKSFTLYAKWSYGDGSPAAWVNPFDDVSITDWFCENVMFAYENGLMKGISETTFAPNLANTRGMFVTILYRMENEPPAPKLNFADVPANEYYANAVAWANANGIVNGVSETEFAPDANITREQMAAILYRYAQFKEYDISVGENTNILSYTDFDKISEYAIPAMQYAAGSGLIKGRTESTLNPQDNATRAETAAILQRFIEMTK